MFSKDWRRVGLVASGGCCLYGLQQCGGRHGVVVCGFFFGFFGSERSAECCVPLAGGNIEAASWFMVSAASHTNTHVLREEPGLHRYSLQLLSCRSDEYIHQLDLNVRCGGLLRQTRKASEDLISTTNTMINFIFKLLNTKLQYTTHALISMHHMIALRSCHNKRFKVRTLRDIDTRSND